MLHFCISTNWDILLESPLYIGVLWAHCWVLHTIKHCARHMSDLWYVSLYSTAVQHVCDSLLQQRLCQIVRAIAVNGAFRIGICCADGYGCSQGTLCVWWLQYFIYTVFNKYKEYNFDVIKLCGSRYRNSEVFNTTVNITTAIIISLCQFWSSLKTNWSPE